MGKSRVRTVVHRDYIRRMERANEEALADLGQYALDVANVPVDTGALAASGAYVVSRNGNAVAGNGAVPDDADTNSAARVDVGYGDEVAHLLEFGTIKMAAQPFATPAMLEALEQRGGMLRKAHRRARTLR